MGAIAGRLLAAGHVCVERASEVSETKLNKASLAGAHMTQA